MPLLFTEFAKKKILEKTDIIIIEGQNAFIKYDSVRITYKQGGVLLAFYNGKDLISEEQFMMTADNVLSITEISGKISIIIEEG